MVDNRDNNVCERDIASVYGNALARHRAFWARQHTDRPLLGCNIGQFMNERYPRTTQALPEGLVNPEDIRVDLFLEDCEQQYLIHRELADDYPFIGSPFKFVPWLEAIMGCPIMASPHSLWAQPYASNWDDWHWKRPTLDNPWARKLLELMQALAEHSRGRYPVSATLMRGPSDMLAALRGAGQLPLDVIDYPDMVKKLAELCAHVWIEVAKAQQAVIPDRNEGYMDGDRGARFWSPEKGIWLQEDALSLLSPRLYRELFLPIDRHIAAEFPAVAFHLHSVSAWAVGDLISAPEIDIIEIDFDDPQTEAEIERTFEACKLAQMHKPLIVSMMYNDSYCPWLKRILTDLSPQGLSIQIVVRNIEEGELVKTDLLERFGGSS